MQRAACAKSEAEGKLTHVYVLSNHVFTRTDVYVYIRKNLSLCSSLQMQSYWTAGVRVLHVGIHAYEYRYLPVTVLWPVSGRPDYLLCHTVITALVKPPVYNGDH